MAVEPPSSEFRERLAGHFSAERVLASLAARIVIWSETQEPLDIQFADALHVHHKLDDDGAEALERRFYSVHRGFVRLALEALQEYESGSTQLQADLGDPIRRWEGRDPNLPAPSDE